MRTRSIVALGWRAGIHKVLCPRRNCYKSNQQGRAWGKGCVQVVLAQTRIHCGTIGIQVDSKVDNTIEMEEFVDMPDIKVELPDGHGVLVFAASLRDVLLLHHPGR